MKGHHDIRLQSPGGDTWVSSHRQEPLSDPEAVAEEAMRKTGLSWGPLPRSLVRGTP